jgi:hypothetical protein
MPTTRRRRLRGPVTAPLTLALMDFLLDGHTRNPDDVPADERDYDHFVEFDPWPPEKIEALWQAHGDALRAEQRRRAQVKGGK